MRTRDEVGYVGPLHHDVVAQVPELLRQIPSPPRHGSTGEDSRASQGSQQALTGTARCTVD